MTILHLVTERQYRGAQVFAAELCTLLAKNGHTIIFAGLYPPPSGEALEVPGVQNVDLHGKKSALDISLVKKLAALVKQYQPDIIQANGSDTLKYAVLVKKLYFPGTPVMYRNISMVSSWASAGSLKNLFNRMLFRQVDFVTSVGKQSLEDLIKTYHFPAAKTKVINRGIPDEVYDHVQARAMIRNRFGWAVTDPVLMHIGQFSDEKNHPFLINSFEQVLLSSPSSKLVFIGKGKNLEAMKKKVQEKGLDGKIAFAGHQSPVQAWLAGSDLFILGSTIEGVPGVILEAAMQSIPSVAVNVGGVGEVVRNAETGILLQQHDVTAFGNAVSDLIQDEQKRKALGSRAREFVSAHYSLQACLNQFESLYAGMKSKGSAKR